MAAAPVLHRFLGLRAGEAATVWLFFCHNFLLGIGTILVYVSANVILLENNPETSLPLAYMVSAVAMMGIGKIYTYFEHHLLLQRLAVRVLLAVIVMTFVMALLVFTGYSIAAAVAIMAGYRIIYLLTNLEFWGISAVVFDVRQSKRLFSVISAGDMPAKAIGALLSVIVHHHSELYWLLFTAFGAYMGALAVLRYTLESHNVDTSPAPVRLIRRAQPSFVRQLFGGSELVFTMCLSLLAIAGVVTTVEYFFFVNVKHKFHAQADVMMVIGLVLGLTYLLAMVFKLLFSRQTFERIGIRRSLGLLPLGGLLALILFGGLHMMGVSDEALLIYFCGLYLLLEVLRRSVFDPVFLVMFQPLSPPDRLKGHTLVKGFYEPLGMGIAGLLLLIFNHIPNAESIIPYLWMGLFMGVALFFLNRSYRAYLIALKDTLERRFSATDELALPATAVPVIAESLRGHQPEQVLTAIDWLRVHHPDTLSTEATRLLSHPDSRVRSRTLTILKTKTDPTRLENLALNDPDAHIRERAAFWFAHHAGTDTLAALLTHADGALRAGLIDGWLSVNPTEPLAQHQLRVLMASSDPQYKIAALKVCRHLPLDERVAFISNKLTHTEASVQLAAISAAGHFAHPDLTPALVDLLNDNAVWQRVAVSLTKLGSAAVPYLSASIVPNASPTQIRRIAGICAQIATADSKHLLLELVRSPNLFWRAIAGRDLRQFPHSSADTPLFQDLLADEWQLANRILAGELVNSDPALQQCLDYEWQVLQQRVFGWLSLLYDPAIVADAQRGIAHAARDRKANALEILDNLIPRLTYRGLQALVDTIPLVEKQTIINRLSTPIADTDSLPEYIVRKADTVFSAWTVAVALRQWLPADGETDQLSPLLESDNVLIRESAFDTLQRLAGDRWEAMQSQLTILSNPHFTAMSHTTTSHISALERVLALKNTALFAATPENVLASVVPIMKEVTYHEGQAIFTKGDPGNCMFIVYDGEVGIFDGDTQLATAYKGGFFGELALLDAETRSASAIALDHTITFRIDQADFYDLTEERGEVLQSIIRVLCQRLRKQNELLRA